MLYGNEYLLDNIVYVWNIIIIRVGRKYLLLNHDMISLNQNIFIPYGSDPIKFEDIQKKVKHNLILACPDILKQYGFRLNSNNIEYKLYSSSENIHTFIKNNPIGDPIQYATIYDLNKYAYNIFVVEIPETNILTYPNVSHILINKHNSLAGVLENNINSAREVLKFYYISQKIKDGDPKSEFYIKYYELDPETIEYFSDKSIPPKYKAMLKIYGDMLDAETISIYLNSLIEI